MLNLTEMFSMKPAPVKGARLVKGYAMSGSKCSAGDNLAAAIEKNSCHEKRDENDRNLIAAMRVGYLYNIEQLVALTGISRTSVRSALKRALAAGKVEPVVGKVTFWGLTN
jgi:hypothetical protein